MMGREGERQQEEAKDCASREENDAPTHTKATSLSSLGPCSTSRDLDGEGRSVFAGAHDSPHTMHTPCAKRVILEATAICCNR